MRPLAALLLVLALLAPVALAHSGGATLPGDTLDRATRIGIPARVFGEMPPGVDVHYYRLDVPETLEVRLRLVAPHGDVPPGVPTLTVMGPGFPINGSAPPDVERLDGAGLASFPATGREATETAAFPASWIGMLDRTFTLERGEHMFAIRTVGASRVALMIEPTQGSWLDLFVVPGQRDDARAWAGIAPWPALVAGSLGAGIIISIAWRARGRNWSLHNLAAFTCATLVAASTFAVATDAMRSGIGWWLVAGGLVAAGLALWSARVARAHPTAPDRVWLFAAGMLAFFVYGGFLWGPVAALAGALTPEPGTR